MARHRGRSRSRSRSSVRRKHYDDPRDRRRERRSPPPSGLLVRNISLSARPDDLRVPFERFGPIKDIYLPKNYYTGEPRGFGFVKFRYPEDAAEAKSHLDGKVVGGREIRIVFAEENRKTPQEMRRVSRTSSRGSYRRRSPSFSPRRRYHSHSRSPSPARHGSRTYGAGDDHYSPRRSRSMSRSLSPRDNRSYRSREKSPRRSVSLSRSVSPQDEKKHRRRETSPKRSRSPSRSVSPQDEKKHRHRETSPERSRSPSRSVSPQDEKKCRPREGGQRGFAPSRSQSPRRKSRSPARSRSRSHSPR